MSLTYLGKVVFVLALLAGFAVEICCLIGQLCNDCVLHLIYGGNTPLLRYIIRHNTHKIIHFLLEHHKEKCIIKDAIHSDRQMCDNSSHKLVGYIFKQKTKEVAHVYDTLLKLETQNWIVFLFS